VRTPDVFLFFPEALILSSVASLYFLNSLFAEKIASVSFLTAFLFPALEGVLSEA